MVCIRYSPPDNNKGNFNKIIRWSVLDTAHLTRKRRRKIKKQGEEKNNKEDTEKSEEEEENDKQKRVYTHHVSISVAKTNSFMERRSMKLNEKHGKQKKKDFFRFEVEYQREKERERERE